jgi:hypothetical protein
MTGTRCDEQADHASLAETGTRYDEQADHASLADDRDPLRRAGRPRQPQGGRRPSVRTRMWLPQVS